MLNRTEQNLQSVDLCKFFMSMVVVAIHIHPFEGYDQSIVIDIYDWVCGMAVPFFFLCTGYFFARDISNRDDTAALQVIKKYLKKALWLYIAWSIIYVPLALLEYYTNTVPWWRDLASYVRNLVVTGEHYNSWVLWYLLSSIYGLLYIYICMKYNLRISRMLVVGFLLYLLGAFITTFCQYDGTLSSMLYLVQHGIRYFISGRIFTSFFFIPMGMLICKKDLTKWYGCFCMTLGLVLWLFCIKDTFVLKNAVIALSSVGLFVAVINISTVDKPIYRNLRISSTVVYFVHLWVWTVVYGIIYQQKTYGMEMFLITLCGSWLISYGYICYKKQKL